MPRFIKRSALAAAALLAGVAACTYNEELGRSQLLISGESSMAQAAQASWNQIKQQQRVSNDPRYTSRVNRVAPKLIQAAGDNPAKWEVLVFEDQSLNAFALPGGKIGIHTGILDLMQNDAQLAAVVGHEIAHVKYRHSGERYSQNIVASGLIGVASVAAGMGCDGTAAERRSCEQRAGVAVQALGLGAIYGAILPYSRKHELEADTGGVRYMARAGYDSCEAIRFWQRMQAASAGQARPPEFASTHPASQTRIDNLRQVVRKQGRSC
ncbi:M48 family metallopeptidase [Parvularcula sp. ZS-1/3]|uniref:M48 family metallopeptidase n=1 Tax=Parvularcula mediterranea TaxID=2732508 RepID=A0A7Y3W6L7_9PROT|nr:M48 family metallopeptidase [Parvularcula mediterranea]NNU17482.1 M48 family metallopeptidase [Parvularcula mediterranea]